MGLLKKINPENYTFVLCVPNNEQDNIQCFLYKDYIIIFFDFTKF